MSIVMQLQDVAESTRLGPLSGEHQVICALVISNIFTIAASRKRFVS